MSLYLQVPTRAGIDGAHDKAAIIASHAAWTAQYNRDFLNTVREVVKNEPTAEGQVNTWFKYVSAKTYSREFGDVFAHPNDTADHGGDCDDTTILLLAGILALGIPAVPDVVVRNGSGAHVRVRVGLPPHNPPSDSAKWKVLDPSHVSEGAWVGLSGQKNLYSPKQQSVSFGQFGNTNQTIDTVSLSGSRTLSGLSAVMQAKSRRGTYSKDGEYSSRIDDTRIVGSHIERGNNLGSASTTSATILTDTGPDTGDDSELLSMTMTELQKNQVSQERKKIALVSLAVLAIIGFGSLFLKEHLNHPEYNI